MERLEKFKNPLIFAILILIVVNVLFSEYKIIYNHGTSMEPTYEDGELVISERVSPKSGWVPIKFEVVVIKGKGKEYLNKRVIATQGESIEIKNGIIYLNDNKLSHPYAKTSRIQQVDEKKIYVPRGYVWVIGDNIEDSWYGLLPVKGIKSIIIL
jgi:signal peptidase I